MCRPKIGKSEKLENRKNRYQETGRCVSIPADSRLSGNRYTPERDLPTSVYDLVVYYFRTFLKIKKKTAVLQNDINKVTRLFFNVRA